MGALLSMLKTIYRIDPESGKGSLVTGSILIATISIVLFSLLLQRKKSKKPHPPGPWAWPILGNLPAMLSASTPHRSLAALADAYGPLLFLRLGSVPTVVVSDAAMAKEILKTQDAIFSSRPPLTVGKIFGFNNSMIVFCSIGEHFNKMKKIYNQHVLSNSMAAQTRWVREDEIRSMVGFMWRQSSAGRLVNVTNMLLAMNPNNMSRILFGKKYFGQEIESEEGQAEEYRACLHLTTELVGKFYLGDYIPWLKALDVFVGTERKMRDLRARVEKLVQRFIDQHRQRKREGGNGEDFLDVLLSLDGDDKMTDDQIIAACLELLLGGSESSAIVVDWALAHLNNNPCQLKALQTELDKVVGKDRLVDESDLPNLPYLNSVIKETFRLNPPGTLGAVHATLIDTTINNFHIPANTTVIINVWKISRDPQYWDNPHDFLPERFMNTNVDVLGHDYQLIPFGSGRRQCPGIHLAIPISLLSLGMLVHAFEWDCSEKVDMSERYGAVTCRLHPLVLSLRPRLSPHVYVC
eukprot:Gb_05916 [translate_table: standard]